ncbi:MAG: plasminogen-binding N-terminal domain-containing protein [Sulfurovaceae bacterium]|nr:plasminogen-binding N-terminal domain-containing protein [Sulfurovaceae bacterium]
MRKIVFMILSSLLLMAIDLPHRIKTTIQSINNKKEVILSNSIPKGRSGIVIHNYGNGVFAITHTAISQGGSRATIGKYNILKHDNIPTIKTAIQQGDQVIFGNLYNNVLLIAPNEKIYSNITKSIKKVWIHPDIYASFLIVNDEDKITKKNLKKFAIESQVGLVAIVAKDGLRIFDPISGNYLRRVPINTSIHDKAQSPFYARFEQISTDIFSENSKKKFPTYYKGINTIK